MRHFATVISRDQTPIACELRGHGPPLLMVHGSAVDHTRWGRVVHALADRFTLHMMDRRGRGRSGDGPVYAIEREFEDVAAVLEAIAQPACVLAHSYGAICALEAARRTTRIVRMALYEPPLPVPGQPASFPADLGHRLEAMLARDERAQAVEVFWREVLQMEAAEIARLRRASSWPARLEAATTLPREVAVANTYRFVAEDFAHVRVPTLFLLGNRSPAFLQASTRMAAAALPGSRLEVLAGHGHAAMTTGPKAFLEKVLPFLTTRAR
jgi:pimeloyl-ACP methyl ester carboxylesterase